MEPVHPNGNGIARAVVTLVVTLDMVTGHVGFQGAIPNKVVALGMLETAKNIVHNFDGTKVPQPKVDLANGALPPNMPTLQELLATAKGRAHAG